MLEKVVEYFQYWYSNRNKEDVPDLEIPTEQCLELLMAADYLGMDSKSTTSLASSSTVDNFLTRLELS